MPRIHTPGAIQGELPCMQQKSPRECTCQRMKSRMYTTQVFSMTQVRSVFQMLYSTSQENLLMMRGVRSRNTPLLAEICSSSFHPFVESGRQPFITTKDTMERAILRDLRVSRSLFMRELSVLQILMTPCPVTESTEDTLTRMRSSKRSSRELRLSLIPI